MQFFHLILNVLVDILTPLLFISFNSVILFELLLVSNEVKHEVFFDEPPVVAGRLEQLTEVGVPRNLEGLTKNSIVTQLSRLLDVLAVLLLHLLFLLVSLLLRIGRDC